MRRNLTGQIEHWDDTLDIANEEEAENRHRDEMRSTGELDTTVKIKHIEPHKDMNSGQKETTKFLRVRTRENDAGSCSYSENEPRNNGDKGDTSKRTINTSNHVQRTAVFDSSLTRATDYITTPSDQGDTTTKLVSEVPGLTTILEEKYL